MPQKRLRNKFVYTAETHTGRAMLEVNMRTHNRLVFEHADSSVDCRLDGSSYISTKRKSAESSAWHFLRTKPPPRPTIEQRHRRKMQDHADNEKMANLKGGVDTHLPEHIERYREYRTRNPAHIPPALFLRDQRNFAVAHNRWVGKAKYSIDNAVEPWCMQRMIDKRQEKHTKSGALKKEFMEKRSRPPTAMELREAQNEQLQYAADEELLPPKRSSAVSRVQSAHVSHQMPKRRAQTVPANIGRKHADWASHEDLMDIIAQHQGELEAVPRQDADTTFKSESHVVVTHTALGSPVAAEQPTDEEAKQDDEQGSAGEQETEDPLVT